MARPWVTSQTTRLVNKTVRTLSHGYIHGTFIPLQILAQKIKPLRRPLKITFERYTGADNEPNQTNPAEVAANAQRVDDVRRMKAEAEASAQAEPAAEVSGGPGVGTTGETRIAGSPPPAQAVARTLPRVTSERQNKVSLNYEIFLMYTLSPLFFQTSEVDLSVKLGMVIAPSCLVGEVSPGLQADVLGFKPGCKILSIGGTFTSAVTLLAGSTAKMPSQVFKWTLSSTSKQQYRRSKKRANLESMLSISPQVLLSVTLHRR